MSRRIRYFLALALATLAAFSPGRSSAASPFAESYHDYSLPGLNVTPGDFDHDGHVDFASVAFSPPRIAVALGNGDGSFRAPIESPAAIEVPINSLISLVAADLDGDGQLDLVVNGDGGPYVHVLRGNGDGTFADQHDFSTSFPTGPSVLADFDRDGRTDLVACGENNIAVLLGNGDGTLGPHLEFFGTAFHVTAMAAGDMNRDGKLDLVSAQNDGVSVLLGRGDGTFLDRDDYPRSFAFGTSIVLGDLDGDGDLDVVSNDVWKNSGNGHLGEAVAAIAGSYWMAAGDLNGDGRLDVVVPGVSAFIGRGDGTFAPGGSCETHCSYYASYGTEVAVGDVDGDGRPDVVEAGMHVVHGNGDGTLGSRSFTAPGSTRGVADFDRDGRLDLATVEYESGLDRVAILHGHGDGTFGDPQLGPLGHVPRFGPGIGDLNHDGRPDLVIQSYSPQGMVVYLANADGSFDSGQLQLGPYADQIAVADVNGDGQPDVVTMGYLIDSPIKIAVYLGAGNGFFQPPFTRSGDPVSEPMDVVDTDGDGRADVLCTQVIDSEKLAVAVFRGLADGTLATPSLHSFGHFAFVQAADLDHDGHPDLVGAGTHAIAIAFGAAGGTFEPPVAFAHSQDNATVAVGDFEGDGEPDVAIVGGTTTLLLNHGARQFESQGPLHLRACGNFPAFAGDFTSDGRADLFEGGYPSSMIFMNVGTYAVPMTFRLDPHDLDLKSKAKWVTGKLTPPAPYTPSQIDVASIRLNDVVPVAGDQPPKIDSHQLKVKFSRAALVATLEAGDRVAVRVWGTVARKRFEGVDVIRVHGHAVHAPGPGAVLAAGGTFEVTWDAGPDASTLVTLKSSWDDGATWNTELVGRPDVGHLMWKVPAVQTSVARLAIVTPDPDDAEAESELAISEAFTIGGTTAVPGDDVPFKLTAKNPSHGALSLAIGLPSGAPATLAVYDVGGRQRAMHDVGSRGRGWHSITLGGLETGIYLVRLRQAGQIRFARVALVR